MYIITIVSTSMAFSEPTEPTSMLESAAAASLASLSLCRRCTRCRARATCEFSVCLVYPTLRRNFATLFVPLSATFYILQNFATLLCLKVPLFHRNHSFTE